MTANFAALMNSYKYKSNCYAKQGKKKNYRKNNYLENTPFEQALHIRNIKR